MHKSNLLIAVEFFSLKLYAGNGRTNERTHRIPLKPSKTNDIFLCLFAEAVFQASLARYGRYTLYVYVSECACVCVCVRVSHWNQKDGVQIPYASLHVMSIYLERKRWQI